MELHPFEYQPIAATTWTIVSSLLMLVVFFKFNRFWSVRNFDLLLIILLAPGILMVVGGREWESKYGGTEPSEIIEAPNLPRQDGNYTTSALRQAKVPANPAVTPPQPDDGEDGEPAADESTSSDRASSESSEPQSAPVKESFSEPSIDLDSPGNRYQRTGYIWLFCVGVLLLARLLYDQALVRRPMLEPNLTIGGLVFLACSLMMFLFANVITSQTTTENIRDARSAVKLVQREAAGEVDRARLERRGPGYALLNLLPIIPSFQSSDDLLETDADRDPNAGRYIIAAKSLAITSQVFIVLGLVFIGHDLFNNFKTGVAMSTIYLMLPYTAVYTGHVDHCLPAAFMVWALVLVKRPFLAGASLGLATGIAYYPIFLLVLWFSFYWDRGKGRFLVGFLIAISVCIAGLIFTSQNLPEFLEQLRVMFRFWVPKMDGLEGIWALGWNRWYRVPLLVAFIALCFSFAFWPIQKNLGTLMAYTGAVMVAVQFWHGFGGGEFMGWYLPMTLMAVFRPNMAGRVAMTELKRAEKERQVRSEPTAALLGESA